MTTGEYDITITQGITYTKSFTYRDSNGDPIDLTPYTAQMQIRCSIGSTTLVQELTTENGGITLGGALGTVALLISATDTAAMDINQGVYRLNLINGAVTEEFLKGAVIFNKSVIK